MLAIITLAGLVIIGVLLTAGYVGWKLTHPQRKKITATPADYGLDFEEVAFLSREDALLLEGWFLPASNSKFSVLVAHGYGENRQYDYIPILPLAGYLVSQGYNVLLFDLRNSGESEGNLTSVGQYEVRDVLGAVDFLKQEKEQEKIVVHGFSMGGATAILAAAQEKAINGVITDCPFADLESYLKDNLPIWTKLPAFPFNPLLLWLIPCLTGTDLKQVSPLRVINALAERHILFIHGEEDTTISPENSRELLAASHNPYGELWLVPGARHVECYSKAPDAYQEKVKAFLEKIPCLEFV